MRAPTPLDHARDYAQVALVLQGGGALGAYQCGVYEALHEAGIRPTWFAGTSIGAIHAAILAGNPPARRIERLREFWTTICAPAGALAWPTRAIQSAFDWLPANPALHAFANGLGALGALTHGQRGFFDLRPLPPFVFADGSPRATSFYDPSPLVATLERLVDFDRLHADGVRLSIGATNVRTGNFRYFDSTAMRITPQHIVASAALPPAFPAVEIDGELWWDGGVVSNTPLEVLLESTPRRDTLALQVDLWSARGPAPRDVMDVLERHKDIQYSSRTRLNTDAVARRQRLRNALGALLARIPREELPKGVLADLQPLLCDRVFNIIQLIYQSKPYEEQYKDYAFDPRTMREHWNAGRTDMLETLAQPDFFALPERSLGVVTHDVHRLRREDAGAQPAGASNS